MKPNKLTDEQGATNGGRRSIIGAALLRAGRKHNLDGMPEIKMTPEEIRAQARATLEGMEREAKRWEKADNLRIKAELKKKVAANKAKTKSGADG